MDGKTLWANLMKRKACIFIIILLSLSTYIFWGMKQEAESNTLYSYKVIPHIYLENTLNEYKGEYSGKISGFVAFEDTDLQPKDARQYYMITPTAGLDENSLQKFTVEQIIALSSLSPRSLGSSELRVKDRSNDSIMLEDEEKNLFIVNMISKDVTMYDVSGDVVKLITDDWKFRDFIVKLSEKGK
jgi:hypothetical protein